MTSYKSTRYRCDHCGKTSGSAYAMRRHEPACTVRPDRICRMCERVGAEPEPIMNLIAALGTGDEAGVKALRELAEGCPACMLAAIRQSKLQRPWMTDGIEDPGFRVDFDFKAESKRWWNERNAYEEPRYY